LKQLLTITLLFLPFLGRAFGVLATFLRPMTIVTGESAWPVVGASAAALVLGVLGYA